VKELKPKVHNSSEWEENYRLQEILKQMIEEPIIPPSVIYDAIRKDPDDGSMDV